MTLNPIHKYTNFMHKCVLQLELELQLSMVNLERRVQSCRGLGGKLMKDKPNNYTLTLNMCILNKDTYINNYFNVTYLF